MRKEDVMTQAHIIAKEIRGDFDSYQNALSVALVRAWELYRKGKNVSAVKVEVESSNKFDRVLSTVANGIKKIKNNLKTFVNYSFN